MNFDTSILNLNSSGTKDSTMRTEHIDNSSYEIENFIKVVSDISEGDPFKVLLDPTFIGFKLFFHFNANTGLLAEETNTNSALAYLKRIGQDDRYELLKRFIYVLSMVNSITPWMFQDIEGLEELWARKRSDVLLVDHEITITTLETLDGKIQSLVNMYREISWDDQRKVYVLPVNLRRFSMSVYVYDFRMFGKGSTTAKEFFQTLKNTDIKRLNHQLFDLGHCEFTEDSGKSFFTSVSNNPTEAAGSNLTIKYSTSVTSGMFRSITGNRNLTASAWALVEAGTTNTAELMLESDSEVWVDRWTEPPPVIRDTQAPPYSFGEFIGDIAKDALKQAPSYLKKQALELASKYASTQLNGFFMGNVYGFSILDNIRKIEKVKDVRTAYEQVSKLGEGNTRMQSLNTQQYSDNLGNINTK